MNHPIDNIEWVPTSELHANDYNPNMVFNQELRLLEHSILASGWIQPVLVQQSKREIIDGYHRWWLTSTRPKLAALTDGKVPVAWMELTDAQRMCLTIRINRAKGSHVAVKMSEIVKKLVRDYAMTPEEICKELGATKDEVELLLMDGVFEALDIKAHKYSQAWVPAT